MKVRNYRNHTIVITENREQPDCYNYLVRFQDEEAGAGIATGDQTDALRAAKKVIDLKFETATLI